LAQKDKKMAFQGLEDPIQPNSQFDQKIKNRGISEREPLPGSRPGIQEKGWWTGFGLFQISIKKGRIR
jgi:hypothetical protein